MKKNEKLSAKYKKHNVYELTVNCLGKPAKAWLSIPKNSDKKTLPIDISLYGYGVGRELPHIVDNAIGLRVARHSCELMREGKYYDALKKGELKGFGLSARINENPENCYFKFMVLRDYRTLYWVKKNVVEWNGKDITVRGGSMGGFRSIFLSYLDKDRTLCLPHVPWMTDLWASDNNTTRQACESKPKWTPSIRYFDSTFAIKRVKCPVFITAWLGDYVCPPAGIMVLYNNSKTKTSIDFGQNGIHSGANEFSKNCSHSVLKKN
ncbi:MAG: acetylxylan esterase [Opitutales bacterium]|nr:acetylxylan esterase [Opitutales bacterium]